MKFYAIGIIAVLILVGCSGNSEKNKVSETQEVVPSAPTISYKPLNISEEGVADFTLMTMKEGLGTAINYQARAGVMNVFEQVVDDITLTGYVVIQKAYSFGDKYVLIVSTGEGGQSCAATTYAFTFDTKTESVTGKSIIDGCSEIVEALAEGNKLTVKKDGKVSIIYNGEVKTKN